MELNLKKAVLLLAILLAALASVSYGLQQVNPAEIPQDPVTQSLFQGLLYVFTTSTTTPLWVFVRNVYGYLAHRYGGDPDVKYEGKQLAKTYIVYEGYIKGYTALALTLAQGTSMQPYVTMLAGCFAFVTDLVRSSLADIASAKATVAKSVKTR